MFHSLKYSVTFPETGRTLAQDLTFEGGFWAITGPNEVGKSIIFEMLRYLLFGTAALRGVADDYKTLVASGEFSIRDQRYRAERTTKKATLWRGDEVVATGTTTVNEKIVQLLGFGLLVFDMANSINQGEVERLGNLTPTERKRMVDNVLGIDLLDVVGKWGAEEARLLDREAATLQGSMVMPTLPTPPEGYKPTAEIDLEGLRARHNELLQIRGYLQAPQPARPVEPTCSVAETAEWLAPAAGKRAAVREAYAKANAELAALPTATLHDIETLINAEAAWECYDECLAAEQWLKANPLPSYTADECGLALQGHNALDIMELRRKRHAALVKQIEEAKAAGACTGCGLPFAHDHIDELETELGELVLEELPSPSIARDIAERTQRQWATFDQAKFDELSQFPAPVMPSIRRQDIPTFRAQIEQVARRAELAPQVKALKAQFDAMPDYEAMLVERRHFEASLASYQTSVVAWDEWKSHHDQQVARAAELDGADAIYQAAAVQYQQGQAYETALAAFEKDYERYQAQVGKLETLKADADKYRKVRTLMDTLRSLVKQHVLPSLNRVASHLLRGMTGGQRQQIVVDEDFNVIVDRQRLDTLSGSGKACANLALRIALGQVLTNRVMSVLLADEVDASFDDFRAQQTSDVLYTLENTISQVLLVSHKSIDVPNVIALGGVNGTNPDLSGTTD